MRLRSTSRLGFANRKLSRGTRLWPPARTLASTPPAARAASASSSVRGATYSNGAGFIPLPAAPPSWKLARIQLRTEALELSLCDPVVGLARQGALKCVTGGLSVAELEQRASKHVRPAWSEWFPTP